MQRKGGGRSSGLGQCPRNSGCRGIYQTGLVNGKLRGGDREIDGKSFDVRGRDGFGGQADGIASPDRWSTGYDTGRLVDRQALRQTNCVQHGIRIISRNGVTEGAVQGSVDLKSTRNMNGSQAFAVAVVVNNGAVSRR